MSGVAAPSTERADWIDVDPSAWRAAAAGGTPLRFRHRAGEFTDFGPSALLPAARKVPPAWVVVNDGNLGLLAPPAPKLDYPDGAAALRDLSERCLSVRLYHVNHTPEFGPLVRGVLDEAGAVLGSYGGGMVRRDSSLFCGSPGSVVPTHCDRHDNLLLQLVGTKRVAVGHFDDPARELAEIERNFGRHLNLEVMPDHVAVFDLSPGDGLYLPPYTIHSVRCGPVVSTALSASFSTAVSERAELVHLANRHLRRLHLRPRGPGRSRTSDWGKATSMQLARRLRARRTSR